MFILVSGIAFFVAWLVSLIVGASANDEPDMVWVYLYVGLPLAQTATFIVYRTTRNKQVIGGMILAGMAVFIAASSLATIDGPYMMFFFLLTTFNFVLYVIYERLQRIARSVEPYRSF
jgi:hypothetical protein